MTEDMTIIAEEAYLAAKEILEKARLEQGELFVVLKELVIKGITINKFEIMKPTLNDIFIEKVGE